MVFLKTLGSLKYFRTFTTIIFVEDENLSSPVLSLTINNKTGLTPRISSGGFFVISLIKIRISIMTHTDYIKANRRGSREAELENQTGWCGTHKVHPSKKTYTRKTKHKQY